MGDRSAITIGRLPRRPGFLSPTGGPDCSSHPRQSFLGPPSPQHSSSLKDNHYHENLIKTYYSAASRGGVGDMEEKLSAASCSMASPQLVVADSIETREETQHKSSPSTLTSSVHSIPSPTAFPLFRCAPSSAVLSSPLFSTSGTVANAFGI